jgi:hypothetical protein
MSRLIALLALLLLPGCVGIEPLSGLYPRNCEVHGTLLRGDTVDIGYGLPAKIAMRDWLELEKAHFPHANRYVPGGCCSYPDSPRLARVKYCPDCRKAEARWWRKEGPGIVARHYPNASEERRAAYLREAP